MGHKKAFGDFEQARYARVPHRVIDRISLSPRRHDIRSAEYGELLGQLRDVESEEVCELTYGDFFNDKSFECANADWVGERFEEVSFERCDGELGWHYQTI